MPSATGRRASDDAGLFAVKADLLAALEAITGAPMSRADHPGRARLVSSRAAAARSRMGPKVIAQFGELHPKVLAAFDLKVPAAGFEIFLDAIPDAKSKGKAKPLFAPSPFQAIERDFAFVVDAKLAAGEIVKAVKLADRNLIDTVTVFDVYEGKGVPEGKKSVAVAVRIQPKDATLTEAEIEALAQKIVAAALKLGANASELTPWRASLIPKARWPLRWLSALSACSPTRPMKACAASQDLSWHCWAPAARSWASWRAAANWPVICCGWHRAAGGKDRRLLAHRHRRLCAADGGGAGAGAGGKLADGGAVHCAGAQRQGGAQSRRQPDAEPRRSAYRPGLGLRPA